MIFEKKKNDVKDKPGIINIGIKICDVAAVAALIYTYTRIIHTLLQNIHHLHFHSHPYFRIYFRNDANGNRFWFFPCFVLNLNRKTMHIETRDKATPAQFSKVEL